MLSVDTVNKINRINFYMFIIDKSSLSSRYVMLEGLTEGYVNFCEGIILFSRKWFLKCKKTTGADCIKLTYMCNINFYVYPCIVCDVFHRIIMNQQRAAEEARGKKQEHNTQNMMRR